MLTSNKYKTITKNMQKILLIEDDDQLRRNTAEILELSNYECVHRRKWKIGVEKACNVNPI
jgi:DNA-binding NtrC family response regulator